MAKKNWEKAFSNYWKTQFDDMKDYIATEQPDYKATFKANVDSGKSYLVIKKEFYQAFFPQYIPVKKEKAPSMKDRLKDW